MKIITFLRKKLLILIKIKNKKLNNWIILKKAEIFSFYKKFSGFSFSKNILSTGKSSKFFIFFYISIFCIFWQLFLKCSYRVLEPVLALTFWKKQFSCIFVFLWLWILSKKYLERYKIVLRITRAQRVTVRVVYEFLFLQNIISPSETHSDRT